MNSLALTEQTLQHSLTFKEDLPKEKIQTEVGVRGGRNERDGNTDHNNRKGHKDRD